MAGVDKPLGDLWRHHDRLFLYRYVWTLAIVIAHDWFSSRARGVSYVLIARDWFSSRARGVSYVLIARDWFSSRARGVSYVLMALTADRGCRVHGRVCSVDAVVPKAVPEPPHTRHRVRLFSMRSHLCIRCDRPFCCRIMRWHAMTRRPSLVHQVFHLSRD